MSFASFIIAPFLTNDGVCLLFVEIILNAFGEDEEDDFILGYQYPSRSERAESAILAENNKSKEIKSTLNPSVGIRFTQIQNSYFLLQKTLYNLCPLCEPTG